MKEYLRDRERSRRIANVTGIVLTVGVHVCAVAFCSFSGLKYIWPPPQEQSFVIDFSEEEPETRQKYGIQPRSETVDRSKPVEIVQRSESPYTASKDNLTPETKPDDFGDVDAPTPEPREEPKIDPRASFPGMAKKDTSLTSPHSAKESSDTFRGGHADGNAKNGNTEGKPNARLQGRSVDGALPRPSYNVQERGVVVVTIWVDNYGKVQKAVAGADGTTVTDKTLWAAARKAAMETHFTMKSDAPALQQGTITYIFNLN